MRVLFLDIDGVLNSEKSARRLGTFNIFDETCVRELNRVLRSTDASIVISSTWRIGRSVIALQKVLDEQGVDGVVVDKTVDLRDKSRSEEITDWLNANQHRITSFAIVDDDHDAGFNEPDSFVQTSFNVGLTNEDADELINVLKRDE